MENTMKVTVPLAVVAILSALLLSAFATTPPVQRTDYDKRLADMGIQLPEQKAKPVGIYKPVVIVGNMAYLSGHIPRTEDGQIMRGKLGDGATVEQGQQAAKRSAIALLTSLKAELGTLNRVKRLVKTTGMVNCTPDFTDQPKVINGCSQVLKDLFGDENGVGARAAVGMSSLPAGSICEIEMIFEIQPATGATR